MIGRQTGPAPIQGAGPLNRRLPRRRVLALLGLGVAGACTGAGSPAPAPTDTGSPTTTATPTPTPTPTPTSTPTPTPTPTPAATPPVMPEAVAWEADGDEVYPNAKEAAARVVEALLRHPVGAGPAELLTGVGVPAALIEAQARTLAEAVDPERQSLGVVVYPQLGGLYPAPETGRTPRHSSVMVVVDQYLAGPEPQAPEDVERVRRTVDVRLEVVDGRWRLASIADAGGTPVARPPDLARNAVAVLDDPRIDLPDSARWDIHTGEIDEQLLGVMLQLADTAPYRVTALRSGHPHRVFGKEVLSNHFHGRAVDIWSVGDDPVVLQRPAVLGAADARRSPAHTAAAMVLDDTGVPELGSPWDLDGPVTAERPSTRSFTNTVHADHLHIAFDDPVPGGSS